MRRVQTLGLNVRTRRQRVDVEGRRGDRDAQREGRGPQQTCLAHAQSELEAAQLQRPLGARAPNNNNNNYYYYYINISSRSSPSSCRPLLLLLLLLLLYYYYYSARAHQPATSGTDACSLSTAAMSLVESPGSAERITTSAKGVGLSRLPKGSTEARAGSSAAASHTSLLLLFYYFIINNHQ
jgi:hypothetical protein